MQPPLTTPRPRPTDPVLPPVAWEADIAGSPPEGVSTTIVSLLSVLLRYRALIVVLAILSGFYAWYQNYTSPVFWTTSASFMPQGARGQSQLSGIAQQFGLGGGDAGQSSAFYMDLVESRSLLAAVANHEYTMRTDSGVLTGTIDKIYGIRTTNPAVRKARMVDAVKGQVEKNANPRTGVITVKVHSRTPEMAVQIARNILDEVNRFNLNRRQAQAGAERSFVEKRLGEAQMELRQAEENLQSFLTENREFKSSPSLQLEFDRLNRTVSMRQQLYNGLAQSYEQAKIEEVRDLPVITVVEPPETPISPDAHGGARKTLIGIAIGVGIGIVIAFGTHLVAVLTRNRESDDYLEFAELSREAMDDVKHPWRIFTRLVARPRQA
jgi:uncharacterized protein involved in exopolysaccharide biosynthesis